MREADNGFAGLTRRYHRCPGLGTYPSAVVIDREERYRTAPERNAANP